MTHLYKDFDVFAIDSNKSDRINKVVSTQSNL